MASPTIGYETERPPSRDERFSLPEFAPDPKPPSAGTCWRTLRHLRWWQMVWLGRQRVRRRGRLSLPRVLGSVRLRNLSQPAAFPEWQPAAARRMIESGRFDFINLINDDENGNPWSTTVFPRLWVYHLNYCDFVNLDLTRPEEHSTLRKALRMMADWCEQNSTGAEVGWEPYPLSLRIVNWLKFLLRNTSHLDAIGEKAAVAEILSSLRCQVLALERTLEFHLRANHLLKNIKALMFAGALLETCDSHRWWVKGATLLEEQLVEQVLPDGGHFERSAMYHAEVLEDLLDLEILAAASGRIFRCAPDLRNRIEGMADFLETILHPDGEIPLLNDSAFGMAPPARELLARAGRATASRWLPEAEVETLPETGYAVMGDAGSKSFLIFDCGPLGPDYQPGHGHCDVLSYELSLRGKRVVVDTGVSTYENGPERCYERSTAAHNTLRIDGEEQAEVWGSFRVGRRPKVGSLESGRVGDFRYVRGSHQGYRRLCVVHTRQIILCPGNCWVIVDSLEGRGRHRIESFIHFHPTLQVEACRDVERPAAGNLQKRFVLDAAGYRYFLSTSGQGIVELKEAWYSPGFGLRQKQMVCCWEWEGTLPARLIHAFVPAGGACISVETRQETIEIDHVQIPLSEQEP